LKKLKKPMVADFYFCGCILAAVLLIMEYMDTSSVEKIHMSYEEKLCIFIAGTLISWIFVFCYLYKYIKYDRDK